MNIYKFRWMMPAIALIACIAIGDLGILTGQVQAKDLSHTGLTALVKKRIGRVKDLDVNSFFGDFSGDGRDDALVVAYYADRSGGNSFEIDVMLFEGTASGFRYLRKVENVYGQSPRLAKFSRGRIKITMATLGPDEPRCCPTIPKEYTITTP